MQTLRVSAPRKTKHKIESTDMDENLKVLSREIFEFICFKIKSVLFVSALMVLTYFVYHFCLFKSQ
jgi:hypothetical protein